jgi:hypothetical protein
LLSPGTAFPEGVELVIRAIIIVSKPVPRIVPLQHGGAVVFTDARG